MGWAREPAFLTLLLLGGAPAEPTEEARSLPAMAFASGAERVQVDLVVRDKQGAILRGLAPADLEVFEDGVRQEVEGLQLVERPATDLAGLERTASSTAEATTPTFVAAVFDRLSPGARVFAQQALLRYFDAPFATQAWFAAFAIDRGLSILQPFTGDRAALKDALGGLLSRAPTSFSGLRERDTIRNANAGLAEGPGQRRSWPGRGNRGHDPCSTGTCCSTRTWADPCCASRARTWPSS
jgi:VWFA-related protein